ncbi:MAG: chloride channel protein [Gammaproteobacteria bacterium]|nr:MAG: chloride channel protein [Gammaproteobacteria bacterium]
MEASWRHRAETGDPFLLAFLGAASGLLAGLVILAFRLTIEFTQMAFLPEGKVGNYEALSPMWRLYLALGGGIFLGAVFQRLPGDMHQVGIVHVLHQLFYRAGAMPLRNAIVQFLGGSFAIITGQSVDREGPGVHLGAAAGSLIGQRLGLPPKVLRHLIACGSAAAIAAAFNTPLAGVVFSMEVIMMEYRVATFLPVILAAVIGAILSEAVYGSAPAFEVPSLALYSLKELPYLFLMGILIGLLATFFIALVEGSAALAQRQPVFLRLAASGLLTGLVALSIPEVMGVSYDTLDRILHQPTLDGTLILVALAKLVTTAVAVGLGMPGGLIGPTLVIGGAAGAAFGNALAALSPFSVTVSPFYAMAGMVAMMGATLQAPLAALIALLEMTASPGIILPAMLAVIPAQLILRYFGKEPVFTALLELRR